MEKRFIGFIAIRQRPRTRLSFNAWAFALAVFLVVAANVVTVNMKRGISLPLEITVRCACISV